jgi:hypothetical protein
MGETAKRGVFMREKRPRDENKRGVAGRIVTSVIVLAALACLAVVLIVGGEISITGVRRTLDSMKKRDKAEQFSFEPGLDEVYAQAADFIVAAGKTGFQSFDEYGTETARLALRLDTPCVTAGVDTAAVYDIGGTALRILDKTGLKASYTAESSIISCAVGASGAVTLCTSESNGYRGCVTVYSGRDYEEEYKWFSGEGYILASAMSEDGKRLAVLTLREAGSRIVFFDLDSTEVKAEGIIEGTAALDIRFLPGGKLLALTRTGLVSIDKNGAAETIYDFSGKYLRGYSFDGTGFTALYLRDYAVGGGGSVVTVDYAGAVLGEIAFESGAVAVACGGESVAILREGSILVCDKKLVTGRTIVEGINGITQVFVRRDGNIIAIGSHSTYVYSR